MGRGPNDSHTVLDVVVEHWPLLVLVPVVLVLIAVLAGVTRWWDRRDGMLVTEKKVREARRRLWRREPPCTCSWHTIGTGIRVEGG